MTWSTAVSDLRTLLSDGPTDRYNSRKRCFGEVNGMNSMFRTFEFRRITDFTQSSLPLGVYKNGSIIPATGISQDFVATGEFILNTSFIPVDGDIIEASYYNQWFIDSELQEFLTTASNWLTSQVDYTQIPNGLWPSALKYAAAEAYLKMAVRWKTFLSEIYRVEDEPKKPGTGPADEYTKMSEIFREEALKARDEFYTRQGRNLQPLFGSVLGNVKPMPGSEF
jgi:hypothetical protein